MARRNVRMNSRCATGWGDDAMGRPYWFRRRLSTLGEQYLLAIPCDTTIRDLEVDPPEYGGRGRPPSGRGPASTNGWTH
jgi:hypothetical protein